VREFQVWKSVGLTAFEYENLPAANEAVDVHSPDGDAARTEAGSPDAFELIPASFQTFPNGS
jgi:hypothetical protein